MSQPDAHTVRNAVIATVVGGIILAGLGLLWPPAKEALGVVKSTALYMWQMLFTDYSVPGWSLLAVALMAVAALVQFVLIFRKVVLSSAEPSYTQDNIHGAKWHPD